VLDDECPPGALLERLAFQIDLDAVSLGAAAGEIQPSADAITAARARLADIGSAEDVIAALCGASAALGIDSLLTPLLAVRAARAAAALVGRTSVSSTDTALAARLVLGPRARFAPAAPGPDQGTEPASHPPETAPGEEQSEAETSENVSPSLDEVVLAAATAAIPSGLLATLKAGEQLRQRTSRSGRVGQVLLGARRGRPNGVRRGEPGKAGPLSLIDTLRAAAPWQPLRRIERAQDQTPSARIDVRREDFRVTRYKQRSETTTIFVVDASGSSAFHRMAEVKGAVELLLADCYVRRDSVALIAFRGFSAELLLPPTRSLVRAKRSLADLPGGGPTPLAAGIAAAFALADATRRKGGTPLLVLMTDGRGNTTRDGGTGREAAAADATAAARAVRAAGTMALVVDTSPKPRQQAEALAAEMGARYLPLPQADATLLSTAIRRSAAQLSHPAHVR
jgi:magnesium chelatase subunit D